MKLETWEFQVLQLPLMLHTHLVSQETNSKETTKTLSDSFPSTGIHLQWHPLELCISKRDLVERHLPAQLFFRSSSPSFCYNFVNYFSHYVIPKVHFFHKSQQLSLCTICICLNNQLYSLQKHLSQWNSSSENENIYLSIALLGSKCSAPLQKIGFRIM